CDRKTARARARYDDLVDWEPPWAAFGLLRGGGCGQAGRRAKGTRHPARLASLPDGVSGLGPARPPLDPLVKQLAARPSPPRRRLPTGRPPRPTDPRSPPPRACGPRTSPRAEPGRALRRVLVALVALGAAAIALRLWLVPSRSLRFAVSDEAVAVPLGDPSAIARGRHLSE